MLDDGHDGLHAVTDTMYHLEWRDGYERLRV